MTSAQLLFFPEPPTAHARHSDPPTSHMAASAVNVGLSQMLVLSIMQRLGEATDEQILEAATLFKQTITPSGARTRRSELVKAGFLKDSGRKGVTKSGNKTIVWELVR
jgi:hypothetical protein